MIGGLVKALFVAALIIFGISYYENSDSALSEIIEKLWDLMSQTADWIISIFNNFFN